MLKLKKTLILFLPVALLVSCTLGGRPISLTGSGNIVTQEESITGFDKVDVSEAFEVEITQGDTFRVLVRIDDNLLEHVDVVKQGGTLKIGMKPGPIYMFARSTQEAEITMPELTGLDASGASHVTITGFKSAKALNVDLSGASTLHGEIAAGDARFDVSGASRVTLSGSGQKAVTHVSGASQVDLSAFQVTDASVEASAGSEVTVNASGRLDADASGASRVYYVGSPTLGQIDKSGASSVGRK